MNSKQRVLTALKREEPDRLPFVDWVDTRIQDQVAIALGGKTGLDEAAFAKLLGIDGISFDKHYPPYFCEIIIDADGKEHLQSEGLIHSEADLGKMVFQDPTDDSYYDDAKRYIDLYGDSELALICGFRTNMLATVFSLGMMGFSMALFKNKKLIESVMERYTEWTCKVLERLQPLGFDLLMSADDIAFNSGPLFSPAILREVFMPYLKQVTDVIKLPWVYHSDGDLTKVLDDLISLGPDGIQSIQPNVMDINEVKAKYGDQIALWGNIDLDYTLTRGTPEEVEAEVKQRIREVAPGGGYIISCSNSLTDYCKIENIVSMVKTIEKYRDYPICVD